MSTARRPADSGRASNNRSSIYRGGDGRWHGRITMGVKNDGSPDRRHVTGKTEKAVTEKVRKLDSERVAGNAANAGRAPTVEQWVTTYLTDIAPAKIAPKTLDGYWSLVRNWIIPHLGKHRLDRLQAEHLDELYAAMSAAGKAPSSILKTHRILSRMLKVAHRRGKVGRTSPVWSMLPPSAKSRSSPSPRPRRGAFSAPQRAAATASAGRSGWRSASARAKRSDCGGSTSTSTSGPSRSGGNSSASPGATAAPTRTPAARTGTGQPARRTARSTAMGRAAHRTAGSGRTYAGRRPAGRAAPATRSTARSARAAASCSASRRARAGASS